MSTFVEGLVNSKLRNMKEMKNVYEVGHVTKVKDYILEVTGLESVGFYERVVISNYSVGYVTAIKKNSVMVAVLQRANVIYVGDEVVTTGFDFCAMYSRASIGHIIDIFLCFIYRYVNTNYVLIFLINNGIKRNLCFTGFFVPDN